MHALIIAAVCFNILVASCVALLCLRARKACDPVQRIFMWGCWAYVLTRIGLVMPPWAPQNDNMSILAAVLVETVILTSVGTWCRKRCPGAHAR